jgi:hypothetical protein
LAQATTNNNNDSSRLNKTFYFTKDHYILI